MKWRLAAALRIGGNDEVPFPAAKATDPRDGGGIG
jgi:hypothetical protein